MYLSGLAPSAQRTMEGALAKVADMAGGYDALGATNTMPWAALRHEHVAAIRQRLYDTLAPATVHKTLCALRGVLRAACQMGPMDAESYHRAVAIKSVRGTARPAGRVVAQGELAAIMGACADSTSAGARDAAIIALGYVRKPAPSTTWRPSDALRVIAETISTAARAAAGRHKKEPRSDPASRLACVAGPLARSAPPLRRESALLP